jgi:hypothetical protein
MSNENDNWEVGLVAFSGLLEEFRKGSIANKRTAILSLEKHTVQLSRKWDEKFPGFEESYFPYASYIGIYRRGVRDKYLKEVIVKLARTRQQEDENRAIINPVCVLGRHARDIALSLESFKVIGTDIDPRWNWFYDKILRCRTPENYEFRQDDIFDPMVKVSSTAVIFFGACGSLSDAAIDYAISLNCPYLIGRTCCHDIIGSNTETVKRFTAMYLVSRLRHFILSRIVKKRKGYYVSEKYSIHHYPRSKAARGLSDSEEFLKVVRNSADSDICRAIIDLDRFLYLAEHGYNVCYRAEMLIAEAIQNDCIFVY